MASTPANEASLPRIIIVGGGFGGIAAARALRKAPARVLLIDKTNHHLFQPLLYQVATSVLAPENVAAPIRHVLRGQANATVIQATVTGVDVEKKLCFVKGVPLPVTFDYLVLATGAEHSYFGHAEYAPYAPGLKTLTDAVQLRNKILGAFEACERTAAPQDHLELLTFVIVGGGPTGVELAGAIAELARQTLAKEFRRFDPASLKLILVEAGPRILSSFDESLAAAATAKLTKLGVEVRTGVPVEAVDAEGVMVRGERIRTRNVFWAAGVKASPAAQWLGAETDPAGRVKVLADCSVPTHPEIFVVGDTASLEEGGKPLPGVAQVAMQQGRYVGRLIARRLDGKPAPLPFKYFDKGNLATVGRNFAVMEAFGIRTSGLFAKLIWAFVHIQFLSLTSSRIGTLFRWSWKLVTRQRLARLIIEPAPPPARDHEHPAISTLEEEQPKLPATRTIGAIGVKRPSGITDIVGSRSSDRPVHRAEG
jgi:NADH dehydrogenase FAD-containing subunit